MSFKIQEKKKVLSVTIKQQLTIDEITVFYRELIKMIDGIDEVKVNIKELKTIDVSAFQVLCGLKKYCEDKGMKYSYEDSFSKDISDFYNQSRILSILI